MATVPGDTILETHGLTKEFKGLRRRGPCRPEGAARDDPRAHRAERRGQDDRLHLLTKVPAPTSGAIVYNGIDITRDKPADVARRGIIRSFQISAVFPNLTVLENVRIALQRKLGTSFHFWNARRRSTR
jgi:branched-chain amino acid transport system ATP-binding protein